MAPQGKLAINRVVANVTLETGDGELRYGFVIPMKGDHTLEAIAEDLKRKFLLVTEHAAGIAINDHAAEIKELTDELLRARVELETLKAPKPEPVPEPVAIASAEEITRPRRRRE